MRGDLADLSIGEAGRALRSGTITARALAEETLDRIASRDAALGAFIAVTPDLALAEADAADAALARGFDFGPLHGIPYALKDNIDVAGLRTGCNSQVRNEHRARSDSAVRSKLRDAGATLVGKLTLPEFATGGRGDAWPTPWPRNPWDSTRQPGGSSSGAGVAVAAGLVRLAVGTDTGGSLRQPAAYCGVVGLKPTHERISLQGIVPLSETLDHCGPMTPTVEEAALALETLVGDERFGDGLDEGLRGVRVGVPAGHFGLALGIDPLLTGALDRVCAGLDAAGASLRSVTLPPYDGFRAAGMTIMLAEAYRQHRRELAERLHLYAPETAERILLGAAVTETDLARAYELRRRLVTAMDTLMEEWDVLLTVCGLGGAPPLTSLGDLHATPQTMPTLPFNVTGHPAVSVPAALDADGLPLALQLVGPRFGEKVLLRVAWHVQEACRFADLSQPRHRHL